MSVQANKKKTSKLPLQIGAAFFNRLLLNTARRFIYPFAPALSRGLDVPVTAITSMIAVNQITGILSLLFGPLADRWGYRLMFLSALGIMITGMFIGAFMPYYTAILTALFMAGLAKSIYDPSILAYTGKQVSFEKRGLAIGVLEMSWAGSSLLGIPLIGILIEHCGWRSPFFVLGILACMGMAALAALIPKSRTKAPSVKTNLLFNWKQLLNKRAALGALLFAFFFNGANDTLFVVYGIWLDKSFHLSIVAIGMGTIVIGLAELLGEGCVAFFADRMGLKQSVISGLFLSAIAYAVLPVLGKSPGLALTALFLVFLAVEFTIVSALSFFTEILPDARATMMSGYLAASSIGRVCGALLGGQIWMVGGINLIGIVSAFMSILALISIVWGMHKWQVLVKSEI